MLSIKKAPIPAALRGKTGTGANPRRQGDSTLFPARWKPLARVISYQKATCQGSIVVCGGLSALTREEDSGMVEAPKYTDRRTASAIPVSPQRTGKSTGKSIAESSAYHALPEVYPAGACLYWQVRCPGQPQGPGSLSVGWGAPCLPLFF